MSWATTGDAAAFAPSAPPAAAVTVEEDLKQKLARMQLASAGQAREFRLQMTHQTRAAANVEDSAAAAAAASRRRKHEDAYDREVRLRKAKLDEEAKAAVEAQRVKLRRDADFLRRQMEERNEADASERRRMREVDPALDFIAQQRQHAPRDPAVDRAAAAKYKRDLDRQNNRKKQHMWDEFVLDRLQDEKRREENLMAMGRQHLQRRLQREREMVNLRSSWAQAVDDKAARKQSEQLLLSEVGGGGGYYGGVRGARRGANNGW